MKLTVASGLGEAAELAARAIANALTLAVSARGHASIALSGGSSPAPLLRSLATQAVPWGQVEVFQVDERQVEAGNADRNWTMIEETLMRPTGAVARPLSMAARASGRTRRMLAMSDAARLRAALGEPAKLDVVHLGLGADGHTASWPPGHAVLDSTEMVAAVADFNGQDRVTLTPLVINSARQIVWFVVGQAKVEILERLISGDPTIPAGRVASENAHVFTDVLLPSS